ncbi:MAG: hypothetical protein V7638_972, partial [Acidobacteriota bacterium]
PAEWDVYAQKLQASINTQVKKYGYRREF